MTTMETCMRCGANIDKTACGVTYMVLTTVSDSEEGTKKTRNYLCECCTSFVTTTIECDKIDMDLE